MELGRELGELYQRLLGSFGHRNWWPGETPFEIMVGAVLTQNTAWLNVEKALANLKEAGVFTPAKMAALPREELAKLITPAGYYNVKAQRLGNFLALLAGKYRGRIPSLAKRPTQALREELLAVNGIGPETADCMLLYALERPVFVIDAYTFRVLSRHGLARAPYDYPVLQAMFMENLEQNVEFYNDFHAQLVHLGHHFCKRGKPLCDLCPANGWRGRP